MQNEQCGLCWDLKFDRYGTRTHDLKRTSDFIPHNFTPLDYCVRCRKPEYDPHGLPTHPYIAHNFQESQKYGLSHKFNSASEDKTKTKRQKRRIILACFGVSSVGITTVFNFSSLLF